MQKVHHFVLVHGLGHGAWCWFKVSALLQAQGHSVTALDLASSGINKSPAHSISSIPLYLSPLTHFLAHSLPPSSQVVLVGHSLGGSSISYAMELFPDKVCMAIFVCALMPPPPGSLFLPPQYLTALIDAGAFTLVNDLDDKKKSSKPTSIHTSSTEAPKFFYNNCSLEQDKILASTCLNPTPITLTQQSLSLSVDKYGTIPRFYIRCIEDLAIPINAQDLIINENPPLEVFTIPQSDHSPFFCLPNTLVDLLVTIANTENA